jgi:hypothetical protein
MPRPLSELHTSNVDTERNKHELGVTGRTGRSFAAAASVLLLSTLVVNRSSGALTGTDANATAAVGSGSIELTDDDQGRSLFDLTNLTPARPEARCVEVTYGGTILPVALRLRAEADGSLADFLDVTIDEGTGGGFESCDGFTAVSPVFDGPLTDLTALGWVELGDILNAGDGRTYRISLQLEDNQEALTQETNLELAWEVEPS